MSDSERIKLIWDFRGPDSLETAKHHCIHLEEFSQREKIQCWATEVDQYSDMHAGAYMVIERKDMIAVRDALRPHRGEVWED